VNRDPWAWRIDSGGFRRGANRRIAAAMIDEDGIRQRWESMGSKLDERGRRLFAANEVQAAGYGSLAIVSAITGISRSTINRGEDDLDEGPLPEGRVRRKGGGGKPLTISDPTVVDDLRRLVEPVTVGLPEQPLRWVSKSREKLAQALGQMGHAISANTVAKLLSASLGFSRQHNRKAEEGSKHPDRNAQFEHINAKVVAAQAAGQPVISVDTKKKELVGNYKNGGSDYRPKGDPLRVKVHDFEDKEQGKVSPYGVYDVTANDGFVSVGITADTAEFAVQSIRTWLDRMGRKRYPTMSELTITADGGGSNGSRVRLWKVELQKLADETRLALHVHHYPPGTSKWNRIEHRLFCHITQNWRGRPLMDRISIVELIGATTTKTGLKVECALDERTYEKGIKVSDAEMEGLDITGDTFHPEWNYTIKPRRPQNE
jgi:Rhodopirellula transposase DDE domain